MNMLFVSATDSDCLPEISAALAAAQPGATVAVRPGTYRGELAFKQDVTIVAEAGPGSVVIEMPSGTALLVESGNVLIRGIELRGGDSELPLVQVAGGSLRLEQCDVRADGVAAMHLRGGEIRMRDGTISNPGGAGVIAEAGSGEFTGCTIEEIGSTAIAVAGAVEPEFVGCVIRDVQGTAVLAGGTAAPGLEDCRISGVHGVCVVSQQESRPRLTNTVIESGRLGLYVVDQASPTLRACRIVGTAGHAVVLLDQAAPTLTDCVIEGAAGHGVHALGEARGRLTGCRIERTAAAGIVIGENAAPVFSRAEVVACEDVGVLLTGSCTATFDDVAVRASTVGVSLEEQANPLLRNLRISEAEYGLQAIGAAGRIEDSQFTNCGQAGAVLTGGSRAVIRGSRITGGRIGVRITDEAMVGLTSCELTGASETGVLIEGSASAELSNCRVRDAAGPGLRWATGSTGLLSDSQITGNRGDGVLVETTRSITLRTSVLYPNDGAGVRCVVPTEALTLADLDTDLFGGIVLTSAPATPADAIGADADADAGHAVPAEAEPEPAPLLADAAPPVPAPPVPAPPVPAPPVPAPPVPAPPVPALPVPVPPGVVPSALASSAADSSAVIPAHPDSPVRATPVPATSARAMPAQPTIAASQSVRPTTPLVPAMEESISGPLAELQALVGLEQVKEEMATLIGLHRTARHRIASGLRPSPVPRHLVFTGSSGTGKAMVARIYATALAVLGVLDTGRLTRVTAAQLALESDAGPAAILEQALGGVLLIDFTDSAGAQTRTAGTLIDLLVGHEDDLAVVIAGDAQPIRSFLNENAPLASWFGKTLEFGSYSDTQLVTIVERLCRAHRYVVDNETQEALRQHFEALPLEGSLAVGRGARQVFEKMLDRQEQRLARTPGVAEIELSRLLPQDISPPVAGESDDSAARQILVGGVLSRLAAMVAIPEVKRDVTDLVDLTAQVRGRRESGLPAPPMSRHLVLMGVPGTGKSTVARLYAELLTAMGLSTTGRFVELPASDLVGLPVGDSAQRIVDAVNRAGGGVLLITKADIVASSEAGDTSGREAIFTLTRVLAGNQDDVAVVLAGEPTGMTTFLAGNRSLAVLFNPPMKFSPYLADELVVIFQQLTMSAGHQVGDDTLPVLHKHFEQIRRDASFDNGRYLRRLLDQALARQAARLRTIAAPSLLDLELLSAGDMAGALAGLGTPVDAAVPGGSDEVGRRGRAFRRLAATVQNRR